MNDHHIASVLERVQKATFIEMLATLAFAMMLVSIVILFEVRTAFFQRYLTPDPQIVLSPVPTRLVLTSESIRAVEQFAASNTDLAAVGVMSVDLSENTRTALLMIYNDKKLEVQAAKLNMTTWPLFTSSPANNSDISSLLNGEFTCSPAQYSTLALSIGPNSPIKTTCRVPVPPYYGRLTGYLVMHSTDELSIYQVDRLRNAALRLSIDMYYANTPRAAGWSVN